MMSMSFNGFLLLYCWLCPQLMIEIGNGAFLKTENLYGRVTNNYGTQQNNVMFYGNRKLSNVDKVRMINDDNKSSDMKGECGRLEELKQREEQLAQMLAEIRQQKVSVIRSRPLTIGVIGFGRFGQFISKTFSKYGRVVATSRTDYSAVASDLGVEYVPLSDLDAFFAEGLDVIVVATSILSFDSTIRDLVPYIQKDLMRRLPSSVNGDSTDDVRRGPLVVDVASVKEHPRQVLLDLLPKECDILCTHPMFGPDSGKNGWNGLNFVFEKTRIDSVVLDPYSSDSLNPDTEAFLDSTGRKHSIHENSDAHIEGVDRMERFLSIWEEEGCNMVQMSCKDHDAYAANSQFITHLMGRILGSQGLSSTPIDTSGFKSVLQLIDSTTADSFDLFYGLYKYNQNSIKTIMQLRDAMDQVVQSLQAKQDDVIKQSNLKHWERVHQQLQEQQKGEGSTHPLLSEKYVLSLSNPASASATTNGEYVNP